MTTTYWWQSTPKEIILPSLEFEPGSILTLQDLRTTDVTTRQASARLFRWNALRHSIYSPLCALPMESGWWDDWFHGRSVGSANDLGLWIACQLYISFAWCTICCIHTLYILFVVHVYMKWNYIYLHVCRNIQPLMQSKALDFYTIHCVP